MRQRWRTVALTVSKVARLSGVSVRTLHHYDELGLLHPSGRTQAGYRLYERADLDRLQQILFFKELDFPLEEIKRIVGDPDFDLRAALLLQRQLLSERSVRLTALISAVNAALESLERGKHMNEAKMFEAFENEAREKWGQTESYKESKRRTARYGKQEWQTIRDEMERLHRAMADLLSEGTAATAPAARSLAEAHRAYLERWFYPCSRAMHRGLGEMYVSDARFTANIDRVRPGLALFMRDAFRANAEQG